MFILELRDPLLAALSVPNAIGKLIPNQPEPGITYAFWFRPIIDEKPKLFYGKICLYNDKLKIKLLSAHLPDKGIERL
jgi:hypothetical protein